MKLWKALVGAIALVVALWFLSPSRAIPHEPGLIEISYLGDTGPNAAGVEDAIRVFESESRAAHAQDPKRPVYRVLLSRMLRAISPLIRRASSSASQVASRRT